MLTLSGTIDASSSRTELLPSSEDKVGPGGIRRGTTPLIRYAKRLRPTLNAFLARFSLVGDAPVTDPATFPWMAPILADLPAIRAEMQAILRQEEAIPPFRDFAPGHERIVERKDWRSFFFWGYGYPVEANIRRCPRTAAAVERIPGLVSAIYSVVGPGAHIKRHRGVCKAIMTAHIALKVPADRQRCRMDVDGVGIVWNEGEAVVIDDTYPHEVWNETDETRVVLLIQFRRPMRWPGRIMGELIIGFVRRSAFVQRARRNLGYWETAFARAELGADRSW
jgi:beta-hydroxylase